MYYIYIFLKYFLQDMNVRKCKKYCSNEIISIFRIGFAERKPIKSTSPYEPFLVDKCRANKKNHIGYDML